jgi:hypothetical protein
MTRSTGGGGIRAWGENFKLSEREGFVGVARPEDGRRRVFLCPPQPRESRSIPNKSPVDTELGLSHREPLQGADSGRKADLIGEAPATASGRFNVGARQRMTRGTHVVSRTRERARRAGPRGGEVGLGRKRLSRPS